MICQENRDIHRLSIECKVQIYIERDIYVPNHARCCNNHLDEGCWYVAIFHPPLSLSVE